MLFGRSLLTTIAETPILQVGCGATGCEAGKMLGLMGAREVVLADFDYFDVSNQTRQFVARANHGQNQARAKSMALLDELTRLFPRMAERSNAYKEEVSDEKAHIFGDAYFQRIGLVLAMVDSNEARAHLSHMADYYNLLFVECGTKNLGGSSTVYLPSLTASYPEAPSRLDDGLTCQVKEFPHRDTHRYAMPDDSLAIFLNFSFFFN
jgi:molybdopterin/thiamine biosynthesis adenylyltransferase